MNVILICWFRLERIPEERLSDFILDYCPRRNIGRSRKRWTEVDQACDLSMEVEEETKFKNMQVLQSYHTAISIHIKGSM
jgi:hypothetical protein